MPRMIRLQSPGCIVHVMARGIDGRKIFADCDDQKNFLQRLSLLLRKTGFHCFAWCLMDNHYHFLIKTNEKSLSDLMRPLNTGYARWYNKKYGRRGYLFQDRYKSVLCQNTDSVREVIRYIHLNPIRGGVVKTLEALTEYPWAGHGRMLGLKREVHVVLDREASLKRFDKNDKAAVKRYLLFIMEGFNHNDISSSGYLSQKDFIEHAGAEKGWPAIMGEADYVRSAMARHKEINFRRLHRKADYTVVLEKIASEVCRLYKLKLDDILIRGRKNIKTKARELFCYKAHHEELIPFSVIAEFLKITIPSVTMLSKNASESVAAKT